VSNQTEGEYGWPITRGCSQSAINPALADARVGLVEKVLSGIYLSDEEKRGIVECTAIKISSLGGVR
jgi:hypothetical protein